MLKVREGQYFQEVLKEIFNDKNPSLNPIFNRFKSLQNTNTVLVAKEIRKILGINKNIQSNFKDKTEAFKYYRDKLEQNVLHSSLRVCSEWVWVDSLSRVIAPAPRARSLQIVCDYISIIYEILLLLILFVS